MSEKSKKIYDKFFTILQNSTCFEEFDLPQVIFLLRDMYPPKNKDNQSAETIIQWKKFKRNIFDTIIQFDQRFKLYLSVIVFNKYDTSSLKDNEKRAEFVSIACNLDKKYSKFKPDRKTDKIYICYIGRQEITKYFSIYQKNINETKIFIYTPELNTFTINFKNENETNINSLKTFRFFYENSFPSQYNEGDITCFAGYGDQAVFNI